MATPATGFSQRIREERPGAAVRAAFLANTGAAVALVPAAAADVTPGERADYTIFNNSGVVLYLALGETASAAVFSVALQPGDSFYDNGTDAVSGFFASSDAGNAQVTRRYCT